MGDNSNRNRSLHLMGQELGMFVDRHDVRLGTNIDELPSASIDDRCGLNRYAVDGVRLVHYPPVADAPRRTSAEQRHATLGAAEAGSLLEAQIASLKDVAALMREQLEDVRKDRDAWRSQAEGNQRLLTAAKPQGGVLSRLFGRAA
jgi:hypothetical protein